jgi:zinc finger SWIM domain-containing protein 3
MIVPEVGMSFESGENAYEMYNTYAGKVGFSIRKSDTKCRVDKTMSLKRIVCSKQGHGDIGSSHGTTKTGCHARILFSISREGIWTVQQVELEHNHYLASPSKTHVEIPATCYGSGQETHQPNKGSRDEAVTSVRVHETILWSP